VVLESGKLFAALQMQLLGFLNVW